MKDYHVLFIETFDFCPLLHLIILRMITRQLIFIEKFIDLQVHSRLIEFLTTQLKATIEVQIHFLPI